MSTFASPNFSATETLLSLTEDLYDFIATVQCPRPADGSWIRSMQQRCGELVERAEQISDSLATRRDALGPALDDVLSRLRTYYSELGDGPNMMRIRAAASDLAESYETLRRRVRSYQRAAPASTSMRFRLARFKTFNYSRSIFHAAMGTVGVVLYQTVLSRFQALLILSIMLGVAVATEVTRRLSTRLNEIYTRRLFRGIIRPWEQRRPSSASYYLLSLTFVTAFFHIHAASVAVLVLAFSDPIATFVGKNFGNRKLFREKSIIGSLAFAASALAISAGFLGLMMPDMGSMRLAGTAVSIALGTATVELFSDTIDDNLTIPIVGAAIATLWFA
jgi:dolichol kinase